MTLSLRAPYRACRLSSGGTPQPIIVTVTPSRDAEARRRSGAGGKLFDTAVGLIRGATPLSDAARRLLVGGAEPSRTS